MKKHLFMIPFIAVAMLSACSDNSYNGGDDPADKGPVESRYLAVKIVDSPTTTTRADNEPDNKTDYENGSEAENGVTNIRFYLFGDEEDGFTNTSVLTTPKAIENDEENPNVEKTMEAVIVFQAKEDSNPPIQIVAVVNPPDGLKESYDNPEELQNEVNNYLVTDPEKFIMSNSVYVATGDSKEHIKHVTYNVAESYPTREEALKYPVEIYVERVVAKAILSLNESLTNDDNSIGDNIYKLADESGKVKVYNGDGTTGTEKDIYIKLLGWNVTGTAPESRLVKEINPSWGGDTYLVAPFNWGPKNEWNYETFCRSFWAINPESVTSKDVLQFGNFNTKDEKSNSEIPNVNPATGSTNFSGVEIYMQENAAWSDEGKSPGYPTKIIIAAQLVDEDGAAVKLGSFAGTYYMQGDLEQAVLNAAKIYTKSENDGATTYENVKDLPIKFITTTAAGDFDKNGNAIDEEGNKLEKVNRYNSYAQANIEEGVYNPEKYYTKEGDGSYKAIASLKDLNSILKNLGVVKVWNEGHTYYWLDIRHLAPADKNQYGEFGVVRNHIYKYEIASIKGFGIPVLDEKETIYPETPDDPTMMFISAKVKILTWRVVTQSDIQIGW